MNLYSPNSQPLHYVLIGNGTRLRHSKAIENFGRPSIALLHHQIQKIKGNTIMTQTLNIPDNHFPGTKEETECPGFNDRQEYCGQIWFFDSWTVPAKVHETLGLQNQIDLYLTSEGHWAPTLEQAEHYLSSTEPPQEFFVRGAILGLFVPGEWAEENGTPNTYGDYRVYRRKSGGWDAEEVEEPRVLAGADYF